MRQEDLLEGLTIITVTRDRPEVLRDSLARTRQVFPVEVPIIIYDDSSQHPEEVEQALSGLGNNVLLRSDRSVGPAGGRNRCVEKAKTHFCLSLDDDCYVTSRDELDKWLRDYHHHADIAVVGFQVYRTYDGVVAPSYHIPSGPRAAFHGGASLLRREVFLRVGGYRELLGFGCEDTELARRVWENGYRVWYDSSYVVQHKHTLANRDHHRAAFLYVRNTLLMESLSGDVILGLPLGLCRAFKRGLKIGYVLPLLKGMAVGLKDTFLHWNQRSPLSRKTARMLRRMTE